MCIFFVLIMRLFITECASYFSRAYIHNSKVVICKFSTKNKKYAHKSSSLGLDYISNVLSEIRCNTLSLGGTDFCRSQMFLIELNY